MIFMMRSKKPLAATRWPYIMRWVFKRMLHMILTLYTGAKNTRGCSVVQGWKDGTRDRTPTFAFWAFYMLPYSIY